MKKRTVLFSLICILLFSLCPVSVCAETEPVTIELWVAVKNGGTAEMNAYEGSPQPRETDLDIRGKESKAFYVDFTSPGSYFYEVHVEPDGRDLKFDKTVYLIDVYVTQQIDGLHASVVIYREGEDDKYMPEPSGDKPLNIRFENSPIEEPSEDPSGSSVTPDPSLPSGSASPDRKASPGTGDQTNLWRYFILLAVSGTAAIVLPLWARRFDRE